MGQRIYSRFNPTGCCVGLRRLDRRGEIKLPHTNIDWNAGESFPQAAYRISDHR
jgi:hypothetical protein